MRKDTWMIALLAAILAAFTFGCGGEAEVEVNPAEALAEKMAPVRTLSSELEASRAELVAMTARIAEVEEISEDERSEEETAQLETDVAGIEEVEVAIDAKIPLLQEAIVDALNMALNDFPKSPETNELLDIYTHEAMILSYSYITEDARYDKAMKSLRTVQDYWKHIDAEIPAELVSQISEFNNAQYLTQEAFDSVENGMSKEEVLEITGPVSDRNKRKEEAKKISYFVYKTKEGPIPAIYFNAKDKVYTKQWDAFGNTNDDPKGSDDKG